MILGSIISGCGMEAVQGRTDIEISSVTADSRKVTPGSLFIAVKGFAADGHRYIGKAVEAGAAAVIYEDATMAAQYVPDIRPADAGSGKSGQDASIRTGTASGDSPVFIQVKSSRYALAIAAANFYDNPSRKLTLVGITGTNGKTTTVTLLYRMFTSLGYSCGLLSTIANYVGDRRYEAANTTSDPVTINSLLAQMVGSGCGYCFMEVSSIGLDQDRVAGLEFKAAIFSNLTHDHLDYHRTFAEYLRCKKLFFDNLPKTAFAITNIDDRNGMVMVQNTKAQVITYSCRSIADHTCRVMEESFDGMQLKIDGHETWTGLIGMHNAYNILAIYSTAVALGTEPQEALIALSRLQPAPGRLENLRGPHGLSVIIDYAHTPDALENVLKTLRDVAPSRTLICLFGCGGDRDRSKRPEMGQIAEKMADRIIVTSDNSRTERTSDIMDNIRSGMTPAGRARSLFIEDREQAIRTAIMTAPEGSTILLAGKGHETYQIIGTEKRHFDEKEIVTGIFGEMERMQKAGISGNGRKN